MKSSNRGLLPVEEGSGRWTAGLKACASLCARSADRMKAGELEGDWRKAMGAARLLKRMAEEKDEPRSGKKKRLLSDGRPSKVPRACR